MLKTKRRTLAFDCLEGKVLLSTGMANPVWAAPSAKVNHFILNGSLYGLPFGTIQNNGVHVASFGVAGHVHTMGRVIGDLHLANGFVAQGKLPNLSNATLNLGNARGNVQLTTASSPSNRYVFVVTSGTGDYAAALGSGTMVISFNRNKINFQVKLHSNKH
jgi:hypothetical protein